ncbi:MAG: 30S ribosomal protein S16 [Planctomycetes bacterium]|nr:30S ribosomal protein S16 [Planctomycetota bacterium]
MAVVIRMKRMGRLNRPSYRIHVTDERNPRDGRSLENLGHYDPLMPRKEHQLKLDIERARFWVIKGAKVSETVHSIFRRIGVYEGEAKREHVKRDRTGRKADTKSRQARLAAKNARATLKAARLKTRVATKKAAKAQPAEKKA